MELIKATRSILLLLFLILFSAGALAQLDPEIIKQIGFSEALLDKNEKIIARDKEFTVAELKELAKTITKLRSEAKACIASNESSIEKVNLNIEQLGEVIEPEDKEVTKKRKSLDEKKQKHETQLATCRLLQLRSNQLIEATQKKEQELIASRLLSRDKTLLQNAKDNFDNLGEGFYSVVDFVVSSSGLEIVYNNRYLLSMLILASVIGTWLLQKLASTAITKYSKKPPRSFAGKMFYSILTVASRYMLALLLSTFFAIYFLYFGLSNHQFPFVALVSIGLFLYVSLTMTLRVFLNPVKPAGPLTSIPKTVAVKLDRRLSLLAKLLFVGFLFVAAGELHEFPDSVTGILSNVYITLVILNLCWAFWLLGYIRGLGNKHLLRLIIILTLLTGMFADWAGYNNLAIFIVLAITGSVLAWVVTHFIIILWTEFFNSLDAGEFAWQRAFRHKLGVEAEEYFPGSTWFRFLFVIVVWSLFAIVMLKIWGMPDQDMLRIRAYVIEGFELGPMLIVPSKIVFGVLIFAVLLSLLGWVERQLQKSWLSRSRMDRGSKESLIKLTGYIGVVLAFLVGVSVAGVKLSNLALIAGALSVGIGFGLQNVVNNFVSGIVLLFERPIKTGDWIMVGLTQGYVKKINLRSTVIQTFERSDVIVPNSEIIGNQVTNMMLNDSVGRVKVPIGVAYGTNPRQVEEILLEIALAHPRVVSRSPTVGQPWVAFREFGDSALLFELRFFITDIDYFTRVLSEINFAIVEAFEKAGIVIPFPQRDVHLKSGELPDQSGKK
jgi:small-conductance mechanosensitive channel